MRRRLSSEVRQRMRKLSFAIAAVVLLIGAYYGATANSPSPAWLVTANVAFGLVNFAAIGLFDRINFQVEAAFEAITGLLIFGTSYVTFQTGPRHFPLATAWLLAGCMYICVAVFHLVKKGQIRPSS
jgi:hypothetical protein